MPQANETSRSLLARISGLGRVLAGKQPAGRGATIFPDDVVLTSYPRSGNTWTRFLLANLLDQKNPVTFSNIESRIPEIYFNPDRLMRSLPRPRLLKSHESFEPHYPRVIYLVRDPRDVAVSFYHHNVKARNIPDDYPMASFVPRFIAAEFDRAFGSWGDNVLSWTALRGSSPDFLMVRYEDLKRDTVATLSRVVAFLERCSFRNIDASVQALQRTVELSSPERMRALEKEEAKNWVLTKHTRADKPFVRSAVSGGWKSQLAPESVAAIELAWGELMQRMGYELSSSASLAVETSGREVHS
jgi:Sulfotransferase domain